MSFMSIFKLFAFFFGNVFFYLFNPFLERGAVTDGICDLRCIINADGISGVIDF